MNSNPQKQAPASRGSNSNRPVRRPLLIGAIALSMAACGASLLLWPRGRAPIGAVESESTASKPEHDTPQPGQPKKRGLPAAKPDGAGAVAPQESVAVDRATTTPGAKPVSEPS